jgi:hypothetical protein
VAKTPKSPQQSRIQNRPPERKPHIPNKRKTQNHSPTHQTIKKGTLLAIIQQAGLTKEELLKLLKEK